MIKNRLLAVTILLVFAAGFGIPAFADIEIFLQSGNGPAGTGIADTQIKVKAGTGDTTNFNASPTSYNDAATGPQARIVNPNSAWVCNGFTPFDGTPRWIGTQDSAASDDPDALYAIEFVITVPVITSATLNFIGCSDNTFGHAGHQGLSVNESEIGGTNGGSHINSIAFNNLDITSLVNTGTNTLYIYQNDVGGPAGTKFSAQILVEGTSTPETDLSITKSDNIDTVDPGDTITYTMRVSKAAGAPATNNVLTDVLPAGVTFVPSSSTICNEISPGVVECKFGLSDSQTFTDIIFDVTVDADACGSLTNTASIIADEFDPDTSNNMAIETTIVNKPCIIPVGGELIPIETTSLLLASAQSFSWMIPLVLSGIGIGLFVVSRKS